MERGLAVNEMTFGPDWFNSSILHMKAIHAFIIMVMFCSAYSNGMIVDVSVTKYGPTGNVMANGEYPHIGAVAVSDRSIPLGTVLEINGTEYVVKDRTAKWVHEKNGLTVDIYSEENNKEMLEFGRQVQKARFIGLESY